jgi:hypothetical protein
MIKILIIPKEFFMIKQKLKFKWINYREELKNLDLKTCQFFRIRPYLIKLSVKFWIEK